MKRAVLFDLDGTLLDTLEDLCDSVNVVLGEMHYPQRSIDEVRAFVGNGLANLMRRVLPPGTDDTVCADASERMVAYYTDHCRIKTKPYDGVVSVLRELHGRGIRTAVVTNKAEPAAIALCRDLFGETVDAVVGDAPSRRRKPERDAVDAALAALSVPAEEAVYIGDSEVDVQTARNAELSMIAVSWGFRSVQQLKDAGATVIADTPRQLLQILSEENKL